ncbi:MAG: aminoacyl-tRNA hydrolase [Leptospirales bacterium]
MGLRAIIGLGNPGIEYQKTRHNAGKIFLDYLSERLGIPLSHQKPLVQWGEGIWMGERVLLVFPLTYMNLSGEIVPWLKMKGVTLPGDLMVLSDDLDLPLGTLRFRQKGQSGGQKGLGSFISRVGSDQIARIRIGIGRPFIGQNVSDYVLGVLHQEEMAVLENARLPFFSMLEQWYKTIGAGERS